MGEAHRSEGFVPKISSFEQANGNARADVRIFPLVIFRLPVRFFFPSADVAFVKTRSLKPSMHQANLEDNIEFLFGPSEGWISIFLRLEALGIICLPASQSGKASIIPEGVEISRR